MRAGRLFFSIVAVLFSVVMLTAGISLVMMPWISSLRDLLVAAIQHGAPALRFTGILFIALALVLLAIVRGMGRALTIRTQMGGGDIVTVEAPVIEGYLGSYWKENFPDDEITTEVVVGRKSIEVIATFKRQPPDDAEVMLDTIEQDLTKLFADRFDYSKPFLFTFRFPK